jgi:hypothetical protein
MPFWFRFAVGPFTPSFSKDVQDDELLIIATGHFCKSSAVGVVFVLCLATILCGSAGIFTFFH